MKRYIEFFLHILVWLCLFIYLEKRVASHDHYINGVKNIGYFVSTNNLIWFWRLSTFFIKAVFFYFMVYGLYPHYSRGKESTNFLIPMTITVSIFISIEYAFFYGAYHLLHVQQVGNEVLEWNLTLRDALFIPYTLIILSSYAYYATRQWLLNQGKLALLDKTSAELALLKTQINPHFLFNTLNNLFAMAIEKGADELAESITHLTGMMRYTIYENNEKYVPLEKEVDYIKNYIKLQELRFSENEIPINFTIIGSLNGIQISPMLLINFVENAFKHGISLKKESFVDIELTLINHNIRFSVINTIHRQNQEAEQMHGGMGLKHTQKLSQLQYPNAYSLEIFEENDLFHVNLEIELQKQRKKANLKVIS